MAQESAPRKELEILIVEYQQQRQRNQERLAELFKILQDWNVIQNEFNQGDIERI